MKSLENQLVEAYVWLEKVNGQTIEHKMVDCTEAQLEKFANHCKEMLYNPKDGRMAIIDGLKRNREILKAYFLVKQIFGNGIEPLEQAEKLKEFSDAAGDDTLPIGRFIVDAERENLTAEEIVSEYGVPASYTKISVKDVIDACKGVHGNCDLYGLNNNFVKYNGIHFSKSEIDTLVTKYGKNYHESILRDLRLPEKPIVRPDGFSYTQLKDCVESRRKNYKDLTTDQISLLIYGVIPKLIARQEMYSERWITLLKQIETVKERNETISESGTDDSVGS